MENRQSEEEEKEGEEEEGEEDGEQREGRADRGRGRTVFISRRARDEFQFSLRDIREDEDEEREKEWAMGGGVQEGRTEGKTKANRV